jgi:hypothetical protein
MPAPHLQEDRVEEATPKSDDARVVEALRALVRQEIGRPEEETAPAAEPSLKEGVWLLLFCLNAILLVSRLPHEVLSDPAVETAGKLLPALLGSLFVIYLAWFRERLLVLTRHRRFNQSQVALLLVLAFVAMPLFPISPEILPKGAALSIDGKPHKDAHRLWLSFGAHDILLQPARNVALDPRQFRFSVANLLHAVWSGDLDWNLLCKADFKARDTTAKVQVQKLRGEYYDDVFEGTDLDRRDNTTLILSMNETDTRTILLPLGRYEVQWILGTGQTCQARPLDVNGSDTTVTRLEDKPCSGR